MFQRFASALFRDDAEELTRRSGTEDDKQDEQEDEDWILVNYLAEACTGHCDSLPGSRIDPEVEDEEEEDEDLVMIPSPTASPNIRYPSCSSLNSVADTDPDPDGGAEDEEFADEEENGEQEEEEGFLRVDAGSLEESWFVTPPPCFTGHSSLPVLLESSPLENLLIEHPSMSVYAHHSPARLTLGPLMQRSLDQELDYLSSSRPSDLKAASGKEKARLALEGTRHRQEVTVAQCRPKLHSSCFAATLSPHNGILQQRATFSAQRSQPLSRKALRRLNLLRPAKPSAMMHLHQPAHRHLNF